MTIRFELKAAILTPIGGLLPLAAVGCAIYWIAQTGSLMGVGAWIYDSAEWLGPVAVLVLLTVSWLMDRLQRPFTHVPPDGAWWEFIVFGACAISMALLLLVSMLTALLLFTILFPVKAILVHTLGPQATVASALVAIPLAYFGVGLAFTLLYLTLLLSGCGNMLKNSVPLFPAAQSTGWLPAAWDTFHFSLATMLGADTAGVSASGAIRWLALGQSFVAKALEIVIVGVGITLILGRK